MKLNEVKIQPQGFIFNNFKPVVGITKIETDMFRSDYYIELVDLGPYYTFMPYGGQPFVVLIPKNYIEKTDKTGDVTEEYVKAGMDDIKKLISQGKTVMVKPLNENLFSKEWWKNALQLNESPPNNFENDDNHQYVEDNLSALNKTALIFNFPVEDLQLAFNGASDLVLTDDVWSKLENSNSYNIQSLGQALLYAKQNKIDAIPYLKAIKNLELLPKALILNYDSDKYYLVNGEFVLSLQKALNLTPDTLMARINPKINEDGESEEEINLVNEFINYVKDKLGLVQIPKIDFSDDIDHVKEQRSFGYFSPDTNIIWIYAGDRNTADIFRTLAHELIHRKQEEDGKINYESGETGSDIENEANAKAGVFLRDFGKKYDGIYDTPIKKFIKGSVNEVKIQPSGINFTFPFWITKQNKSQASFIADQLNKQGYTLKGKKFTEGDITFNIPTILDYDGNYRDQPERKILNTYSPSYEVKIQNPSEIKFPLLVTPKTWPLLSKHLEKQGYYFASGILPTEKIMRDDIKSWLIDVYGVDNKMMMVTKIDDYYIDEVKIQAPSTYKKAYGEVHSYNEMKKWEEQNSTSPSHFLVDRTNNTVLAGFQNYNIPKWAWNLHGNDNMPAEGNNIFALASKSSITNPPPYLNTPNIDVTNPASWGDINKVKKYIKNLNEVKIQSPEIASNQKIWDVFVDINDYIEHLYDMGDDTNDLHTQIDRVQRKYNWDYTKGSLEHMGTKTKSELYKDLKNLQAQFK